MIVSVSMDIKSELRRLTKHENVFLTSRGNTAIDLAVLLVGGRVLIPTDGGWLSYQKIDGCVEVACSDAVLDLEDLESQLKAGKFKGLLYHNPGGYFAEQPIKEIYELCSKYNCLVILDVSGSIGTEMCDGDYADVIVGSFGRWKLIDAGAGGFISVKDKELFDGIDLEEFNDTVVLEQISEKIESLGNRVSFLKNKVREIKKDLSDFSIIRRNDEGLVVIVEFFTQKERESLLNYCEKNSYEWTECPRYIRINKKAISIEVKRLQEK